MCCIMYFHVINERSFSLSHKHDQIFPRNTNHHTISYLPQQRGIMGEDLLQEQAVVREKQQVPHLWANVTGSGHAEQEVEGECLVSSLETVARGRSEEITREWQDSGNSLSSVYIYVHSSDPGAKKTVLRNTVIYLSVEFQLVILD